MLWFPPSRSAEREVSNCCCAPPSSGVLGLKLMRELLNSAGCGSSLSLSLSLCQPGHSSREEKAAAAALDGIHLLLDLVVLFFGL